MSTRPLLAALLAALCLATPAAAADARPKVVLELFTSQGCSSCPPADALLGQLIERDDIIALAYHVDYWDYIGWTDTFGSAANSDYQRAYARSRGDRGIYTPQIVANGRTDVVGSREPDVNGVIEAASLSIPVALTVSDGTVSIDAEGQAGLGKAVVWLVTYIDKAEVTIERGENRGRRLPYSQVVRGRQVVGMWEPDTGAHLRLPLSEVFSGSSNGAVVLIQEDKGGLPGPILGAAQEHR